MKNVGIFEAKTHLSSLLDEVEKGAEVTITRHGRPVAKLVQARAEEPSADVMAQRRAAIARLRARAKARGVTVSHEEIKSWIEDGRH
jgi:prevent-host-death family protein